LKKQWGGMTLVLAVAGRNIKIVAGVKGYKVV
jgi:hypothetical protein